MRSGVASDGDSVRPSNRRFQQAVQSGVAFDGDSVRPYNRRFQQAVQSGVASDGATGLLAHDSESSDDSKQNEFSP